MRVFVTGASGFIGAAVVRELIGAGHEVTALARSDASAALVAAGAAVLRGDLADLTSLQAGASAADGVVHLASHDDFAPHEAAARTDLHAIETLGGVLAGSDRPLVVVSGLLGLAPGRVLTERDPFPPVSVGGPRMAGAQATLGFAPRGVRASVIRLAPVVHDAAKRGVIGRLVDIARDKGVSGYLGDGWNRWPAVHVLDAAQLFRLALQKAPAGSILHGVADEGVPVHVIAGVIGRHLEMPTVSISPEEAADHFGRLAGFLAVDAPATSTLTRELLGWEPRHRTLIEDLDEGHFFDDASLMMRPDERPC